MKSVLIIGMGRFGRHMAEKLQELKNEVLAVDEDEGRINLALPYVTNAQIGDATNEEFLKSLGIKNFDICVVAIGDDFQSSLIITSLLKDNGARVVISRASRDMQAKLLLRNGANEVVYPEKQQAVWAAVKYSSDNVFDYIPLTEEVSIYETPVPAAWMGKTIAELRIRQKYDINIVAVRKGDEVISVPSADYTFIGSEIIFVLGQNKDVSRFTHF